LKTLIHRSPARGSNAGQKVSFRIRARTLAVCLALAALLIALAFFSLAAGRFDTGMADVFNALSGQAAGKTRMIVLEWRLPRTLLVALLGAALGLGGAIFQSLTRNPLGSPDIIGFAAGSHTGALVVLLLFSGGYYATAFGALGGGIVTAALVYVLAGTTGQQGFRLIVVGIGISAMLSAFNAWMIRKADLEMAMGAAFWAAGSLNGLGFEQLRPAVMLFCLLCLPLAALARPMRQMELGDDVALASGVAQRRTRGLLMLLGVALTALATATAGPISFIALCAPQIARRLVGASGVGLFTPALTGAVLLVLADTAAQHAFGRQLPVGIMTISVGGLYLLWLLIREGRR
jgi:iron complex transport system permease protein